MAFLDKFRFRKDQTTPAKHTVPRFAPGWLAENQRTAIRALAGVLCISLAGNYYQAYLREQIAAAPPEVYTAIMDSTFSTAKIINARNLKINEVEALAEAEVRRLVYRLRRIADPTQVQENIDIMYCSVTGQAAAKANAYFAKGRHPEIVKLGHKRVLAETGVRAGLRPGQRASEDGMWITANWTETVDEGIRKVPKEQSAEFLVKRFKDISPVIRSCNPNGVLIEDFELFVAD